VVAGRIAAIACCHRPGAGRAAIKVICRQAGAAQAALVARAPGGAAQEQCAKCGSPWRARAAPRGGVAAYGAFWPRQAIAGRGRRAPTPCRWRRAAGS